ncbi:hypothetical protein CAEBREN_25952 [Caenorhabditis brenneri]|uniref:Smr domain-containing protein n=1 Tax=Caenorhabditis brenneri TaxID=135651 RepID=G0P7K8_CAEBE|nr:hypothetical protein CAEBREN_25952 [Caenorhabditis brenneri]
MNAVLVNDYDAARELAKAQLKEDIALLYADKERSVKRREWKKVGKINAAINERVIEFNLDYPNEEKYLDLHGMTEKGAVTFVAMMCHGSRGSWKLETGRGNNSPGKIPVIKSKLLEIYEGSIWVDKNQGILILEVL